MSDRDSIERPADAVGPRPANLFQALLDLRDEQRRNRARGLAVLRARDLPWEDSPLGRLRWYMHPLLQDLVMHSLIIYEQEIPPGGRSGRLRYQGGMVIYVLEGRGRTVIDGQPHPWSQDDVVQLPLRPDGIVYQHFNDDPERPARLLACEPNTAHALSVDRGSGFEILEPAPGRGCER